MSKHNLFTKKLHRYFLSINDSIESYFNKLKFFITNFKKTKFLQNNRVFLATGTIVILLLSYFLIPTFFNKEKIQSEIKNQVLKRYNINLKFNEKIKYGLLPKPHFSAKNLSLVREDRDIALVRDLKIFVPINQFFSSDEIEINDLVFKKTDFNIYQDDLKFFKELLETEPNENKIIIKESKIFFKDNNDDVLFINKIYNSKFYYDSINLMNSLSAKNEIFNIPYKLLIKNDKFNKEVITNLNSSKIRLNIENQINYDKPIKKGRIDVSIVNKNQTLNYEIKKKLLNFQSGDKKNTYKGTIFFKPFYFQSKLNYEGISTRNLFSNDTIFVDLITSEILNNKNLNANIDLNIKDITNIDQLNNLNLKIGLEQGSIGFSNSNIMWKDDLKIVLNESLLSYNDYKITLVGRLNLDFKNLENFYRSFQIKKNYRKKIENIEIDFIYDLTEKKISFDNVKIDKNFNAAVEEYINKFNNSDNRIFNRVTFKNFINNFFVAYAG